jgi:hypothetical protein
LTGSPVAASWDVELMPAMMRAGRAIHEEQVLDELLSDLTARTFDSLQAAAQVEPVVHPVA